MDGQLPLKRSTVEGTKHRKHNIVLLDRCSTIAQGSTTMKALCYEQLNNGNRAVPHNVTTLVKNVVDLRKVLRKLHAHLGSAIRSFQIT